jgi:hypothetical protein
MEDRVRMIHVRRVTAHAQVSSPGTNPEYLSPLTAPQPLSLRDFPASGAARAPVPPGSLEAVRDGIPCLGKP